MSNEPEPTGPGTLTVILGIVVLGIVVFVIYTLGRGH